MTFRMHDEIQDEIFFDKETLKISARIILELLKIVYY